MKKNYTFKIYKSRNVVSRLSTHSVRRFLNHLRTINFSKHTKVYLKVAYGKSLDNFGKVAPDCNEGYFGFRQDLLQAMEAFNEI